MANEEFVIKKIYKDDDGTWVWEVNNCILFKNKSRSVVEIRLWDFIRNMDPSLFRIQAMPIYSYRNK